MLKRSIPFFRLASGAVAAMVTLGAMPFHAHAETPAVGVTDNSATLSASWYENADPATVDSSDSTSGSTGSGAGQSSFQTSGGTYGSGAYVSVMSAAQIEAFLRSALGTGYQDCVAVAGSAQAQLSTGVCFEAPGTPAPVAAASPSASATWPSYSQVEQVARQVVVQLRIPDPEIRLGPDPSVNEWNMAVIGLPVWVWTTEPATRSASLSVGGYDFRLSARRTAVAFDFGDGTPALRCTQMAAYPGPDSAGLASPCCGHTFTRPSLPTGAFTMTARAEWHVEWSAMGYSGTLPLRATAQRPVRVGELQSLRDR